MNRGERARRTTGEPWHPSAIWPQLRLSSKSHWDLPIDTPLGRIHLLAAHPTPPVFDGPERRNVVRNHDELHKPNILRNRCALRTLRKPTLRWSDSLE